jgi:hypothetical protein
MSPSLDCIDAERPQVAARVCDDLTPRGEGEASNNRNACRDLLTGGAGALRIAGREGVTQRRDTAPTLGREATVKHIGFLLIITLTLFGCLAGKVAAADVQDPPAQFAEDVKTMLDRNIGRVVTLHLASGQEITGTVMQVGVQAVQLSRLAGRDYFDAVVMLSRVDAVLYKVWGK